VNLQTNDLVPGLSWQAISSVQHIYAGHRAVLKNVARIHRATF